MGIRTPKKRNEIKIIAILIPFLCTPVLASNNSNDCLSSTASLNTSSKATTPELLKWIASSKATAQCLGMDEMSEVYDELKASVITADIRRKKPAAKHSCHKALGTTITSDTQPYFPNVDWRSATSNLWKKPIYDQWGEIIGYDESILVSMRPDYKEAGMDGRVYIAMGSKDTVSFMNQNHEWQGPAKGLVCRADNSALLARSESEKQFSKANTGMAEIMSMEGLSDDLKANLAKNNASWEKGTQGGARARNDPQRKNQSSIPLCPPGYEKPDSTPHAFFQGQIPSSTTVKIDLGRDSQWCPSQGKYSLVVGYGVVTNSSKREIQNQLTFGDDIIKEMEGMLHNTSQGQSDESNRYWQSQMQSQLTIFRNQSKKIKRQAERGITESRLVYKNATDQRKCWETFNYYCPSAND